MSDYQYLLDYAVDANNAEEWCRAMADLIVEGRDYQGCPDGDYYTGLHRADEDDN